MQPAGVMFFLDMALIEQSGKRTFSDDNPVLFGNSVLLSNYRQISNTEVTYERRKKCIIQDS
jgi:hypothetical protein